MGGLISSKEDGKETVANLEACQQILPKLRVLANARPKDKYLLTVAMKNMNEVVGVTGVKSEDA